MSNNRLDLLRNKGRILVFDEGATVKDWKELTVVDNVKIEHPSNPVEIKTPSGITIYRSIDLDARISFDWYHPGDLSLIELLFRGVVSKVAPTGTSDITETVILNWRQISEALPLPGFDGDKTAVTVISVVLDSNPTTTYTVTTDYTLAVDAETGMSMLVHVSGGSIPLKKDIRVSYTYRPLKSTILKPIDNGEQVFRDILIDVFTDPADSTKYRRYYLPRATAVSDLMHQHLEIGEENTNPNILSVTLEYSKPDASSNYPRWYWIDTWNV